ncbi:nucleotidyltransferase domain-containing protein [Thermomonas sp. S9]|uniref:nucleotidyltransferase family protein n=1 Tax=Thermomonas sp. S9 TaxID=2885203 RepID=UPI00216B2B8C|nr:nucleotidyltransferase domain-containing protein [Thermomonas sp. S9]MCR6496081.1 nucleotidyltransferase domain-containing protein [Thermomonas sp. S9]
MNATTPSLQRLHAHCAELEALRRRHHVRRLELFGSAARGQAATGSDYDFLVEFAPLPPGGYADAYFGLLEELQELLDSPVELMVERAIRNPYFRQAVQTHREPVYAA